MVAKSPSGRKVEYSGLRPGIVIKIGKIDSGLTDEMRKAVEEHPDRPVYVLDRETHTRYVLLPADTYERVRALLYDDSGATPDEFLPLAHEAFQEDWDAPGMDQYQDYDSHRAGK